MTTTHRVDGPRKHHAGRRNGRWSHRAIAAAAIVALPLVATTSAFATTAVTVKNPGGLTTVGPVNAENGFPSWYQDSKGQRVELCLNGEDPMCGFLPGDIPDGSLPISFPDNFPEEAFYMLAGSGIDLPGGGSATLTLGLEAAFANEVAAGEQVVFARQRIVVKGGPANTTMTFNHPYGTITIDTDGTGAGRITEDISPAAGNFETPLKGNIGPFLSWGADAPAGYLGDPNVDHTVTGGPLRNTFEASWPGATTIVQDQFTVQGKKATNAGVKADGAVVNGNFLDVFATSEADPGELYVAAAGDVPSTPMQADPVAPTTPAPHTFYARIDMTGKTMPTSVTVRNIGDAPISTSQVTVTKPSAITITDASYNGTVLHVAASSASGAALTVSGYGTAGAIGESGAVDIATSAPPLKVSVTGGTDTASADVRITSGTPTTPGLPPTTATPDSGPVCEVNGAVAPCPDGGVPAGATPTANVAAVTAPVNLGDTVVLDASASTNATTYEWTQVSGPTAVITNGTTAKPSAKLQPYNPTATPLPAGPRNDAAVFSVTAVNGGTKSAPVTVSVPVKAETLTVASGRFRAGSEIRVDGTSTVAGGPLVLTPATQVAVYVSQPGTAQDGKLIGTAPVDTLGAWSVRVRSTTGFTAFTAVKVVSSRGGYTTFSNIGR
jgi:hypothetical protein